MPRFAHRSIAAFTTLAACMFLVTCGGGSGGTPSDPGPHPTPNGDFISLGEDSATPLTLTEASGLPAVDCDPRVDWAVSQIVLWDQYTGGGGPNGYGHFLDIMFPLADSIGTYTVHGNYLQAVYYNGTTYSASPLVNPSDGTVVVTRSDSRIEGTFSFTVYDSTATASVRLDGSFGVNAGWSLVCP